MIDTKDLVNIRETEEPMSVLVLMSSTHSVMKTTAGILPGILPGIHPGIHLNIHPGIHPARIDVSAPHPSMHFFHKLTARISVPGTVDARLLMTVLLGDHAHLKKVQITFTPYRILEIFAKLWMLI